MFCNLFEVAKLTADLSETRESLDKNRALIEQQAAELGKLRADLALKETRLESVQAQLASKALDCENLERFLVDEQKLKQQELAACEAELEATRADAGAVRGRLETELERTREFFNSANDEKRQVR